jgi:hypothetical protein
MARIVVAVLTAVVVASCLDLSAPADCRVTEYLGSFSGRASGAASDSMTGCAYFGYESVGEASYFGLALTNGGPQTQMLKVRRSGALPLSAGTHSIGLLEDGYLTGTIFLADRKFPLTAGTIAVGESSSLWIDGTVDLTGTDANGQTLTIRGTFSAKCAGTRTRESSRTDDNIKDPDRSTACFPSTGAR